jgi:dipeptidyl aminopeptidase/acylaminoacyl peptidase
MCAVAVLAAAALLATPSGRAARASYPGLNGRIVLQISEYLGSEAGASNLYLTSGPGIHGEFVELTQGDFHDANPTWSADGTWITFNSNRRPSNLPENMDIWVVRPDGSGLRRLTGGPAVDVDPTWSPDGRRIAFASDRGTDFDIWVLTLGGALRQVDDAQGRDEEPSWSPDGRRIAFSSNRDGNQEIYVMNADGSNAVRLTRHPGRDRHPAWSPDGSRVVFDSNRSGQFDIYTSKLDGRDLRRLTRNRALDSRPAWSPDGKQIVYQSEDERRARHLLWIRPDGTPIEGGTYGDWWQTSVDWQPLARPDRCLTRGTIFGDQIHMTKDEQDDVMCMLGGDDSAWSFAGDDVLEGGPGADSLDGGAGDDRLVGGPGRDALTCGPGRDVAIADAADTVAKDCETVRRLP